MVARLNCGGFIRSNNECSNRPLRIIVLYILNDNDIIKVGSSSVVALFDTHDRSRRELENNKANAAIIKYRRFNLLSTPWIYLIYDV